MERHLYSTTTKTEARRLPELGRRFSIETVERINTLSNFNSLVRGPYFRRRFVNCGPHQEIIRRIVVSEHDASPPGLRAMAGQQSKGLERKPLLLNQSGHLIRNGGEGVLLDRRPGEKN